MLRKGYLQNDVFLIETLPIEEFIEVYSWVVRIITIESVSAFRLGVVLLQGENVVIGPVCGLSKSCR